MGPLTPPEIERLIEAAKRVVLTPVGHMRTTDPLMRAVIGLVVLLEDLGVDLTDAPPPSE